MTPTQTLTQSINHLLFKWLHAMNTVNEKAAELRFTAYYRALVGEDQKSGPLLRYLELLLRRDSRLNADAGNLAEDLIQDLMMQHVNLIQERPLAAERVQQLIPELTLASRGDLFQLQIKKWSDSVIGWTGEAKQFPADGCLQPEPCEQKAVDINLRWFSIRADGEALLKWLYDNTTEMDEAEQAYEVGEEPNEPDVDPNSDDDDTENQESIRRVLKQRLKLLNTILNANGESAADVEAGVEGGSRFAITTGAVIDASSKVRIPMISMLYWKGGNLVRDYFKSKAAKIETNCDADDNGEKAQSSDWVDIVKDEENVASGGKSDPELEELVLWSDIVTLLSQPVKAAEKAFHEARTPRDCSLAEAALAKQQMLYEFNVAVVCLWYEGESEQSIADKLGTTRDKVRTRMAQIFRLLAPLKERGN